MLIFLDDYIIVVPSYSETEEHHHTMLHVIISSESMCVKTNQGIIEGTIILLDKDITHKVTLKTTNSLVLLIDPSTGLAGIISEKFFQNKSFFSLDTPVELPLYKKDETQIINITENILNKLDVFNTVEICLSSRVKENKCEN